MKTYLTIKTSKTKCLESISCQFVESVKQLWHSSYDYNQFNNDMTNKKGSGE